MTMKKRQQKRVRYAHFKGYADWARQREPEFCRGKNNGHLIHCAAPFDLHAFIYDLDHGSMPREWTSGESHLALGYFLEHEWEHRDRPTVFISRALVDWLVSCRYSVFPESVRPKFGFPVAFAIECGMSVTGISVCPIIVDVCRHGDQRYVGAVMRYRGGRNLQSTFAPMDMLLDAKKREQLAVDAHAASHNHMAFGQADNGTIIQRREIFGSMAVAAMVSIYANAFPHAVRVGPPRHDRLAPRNSYRVQAVREIQIADRCVSPHWRSGHFRELRDERFKRNDDGTAKIVFVRDAIVNPTNQPLHTVIEERA